MEAPMKMFLVTLLMAPLGFGSIAAGERFACNMNAMTAAERARHPELSHTLFAAVQEKRELTNGYAFRLPPADFMAAAEWVSSERKCCPFFAFQLELSKDQGPLWLRITGVEGVKPFIVEEFQL
jgi:hypothetical protein